METISISYKTKTRLIEELVKDENIKELENKSGMLSKLFSKKEFADVYFHSGSLDEESREKITNAKKVIVNSQMLRHMVVNELEIDANSVEVVYPSISMEYTKTKEAKKKVCEKLELQTQKRIILFTANNLRTSGVSEFIETIFSLNEQNFYAIIAGDSKQITNLKFKLSKFNYSDKLVLVEDYENIDDLFLSADIFLLPTHNKNFALNVLKAMFCKCAVFTTTNNHAKELIDVFSTIEGPSDRSTPFKLDALLMEKDELKKIKKQNRKVAKEYTLENNLSKVRQIIQDV